MMRSFIRTQRDERRRELDMRLEHARADAAKIISHIVRRWAPRRIYQWGSLVHPESFQEISDIDIAVEGIDDPLEFDRMVAECATMTELPLDLLRLEAIHPLYRREIEERGVIAYER